MTSKKTINRCADCPTRKATEWRVLGDDELESIDKCRRMVHCEAGETIFSQGDPGNGVYCIQSGLIGLRRVDVNGNSVLIRLSSAGSTVGYRTFLTHETHVNSAEALTASVLCYIPRPRVEQLLKANPLLGERFLQHFCDDAAETESDYVRSLTMGMKSRFLHLILIFYERFGYQDENGNSIVELPVKRGELAELVGVRPESISRLIDQLQSDEIMRFNDRRVQFSDVDEVLQQAGVIV
ncbi:MAG: Crp/Fnr family transcriptional regulator [Gammaproteobacteria bacterium]|nr:Crp/Fnr family transcriptional regulator [Gammaproteobacteria bacterium]